MFIAYVYCFLGEGPYTFIFSRQLHQLPTSMLSFFNPAAAVSSKYQHSLYTTPYPGNVRWQGYNLHFTNIRLHCSYEVLIACGGKSSKVVSYKCETLLYQPTAGVQKLLPKQKTYSDQIKNILGQKLNFTMNLELTYSLINGLI